MDPLLRDLQASGVGLSLNGFYAGGFLHSDDIRTLATSEDSLRRQIEVVKQFADRNLLKLNVSECEIVLFSNHSPAAQLPVCEVDGAVMPAGNVGKCLGYWWSGDLSATKSIENNINKSRRAFFHFGSIGVFQGDISPISSRSVLEMCVMPILLYGSENWILTEGMVKKLETFQGELVKRILKWPKHLSNTAAIVALEVPTMRCRILVAKLGFLARVLSKDSDDLCGRAVLALCDDFDSSCLVRECRELEEEFGTGFTDDIINRSTRSLKEVKKMLHGQDKKRLLERCREKASQIAVVAESIGWSKLWDMASDLGWKAVMGLQMLSRAMGHHGRGNHPCHLCNDEDGPLQISLLDHILKAHWKELHLGSEMDTERLMDMLSSSQLEVLSKFKDIFKVKWQ